MQTQTQPLSRIIRRYRNGDYDTVCPKCSGAGLMPGSSMAAPVYCPQCNRSGIVLVRKMDNKVLSYKFD